MKSKAKMGKYTVYLIAGLILGCAWYSPASLSEASSEWLTWGYDQERSGWNRSEATLSKDNVSNLGLKWVAQLSTPPNEVVLSTLTAPLVVEANTAQGPKTLVFVVGSDDTVYAIDGNTGKVAWQHKFVNNLTPAVKATWLCPNTQNATPVVDKAAGIIYLNTSDGKLRGLNIVDGGDRIPVSDYIPPFARNWSLNLIDKVIYTPLGRGCNHTVAQFTAIDLSDPARQAAKFFTSPARSAGAWGRGGMVRGPKGIYTQTADGAYDPASGKFGNTVMALNFKDLRLLDSFTPSDWEALTYNDLDMGSANPVVFSFKRWTLLASAAKQSVLYLLDADNLGGADHHTPLYQSPRWGNDEALLAGRGVWGAMASWEDTEGTRWIAMPLWGPPAKEAPSFKFTYGEAVRGSVMAFQVVLENDKPSLIPVWRSRDMQVPDPPVVTNGVVYALQTGENTLQGNGATAKFRSTPVTNAVLYAFDAENGKELYSSKDLIPSWTHFSEPVVADGKVYVATWDAKVYAFGLKK